MDNNKTYDFKNGFKYSLSSKAFFDKDGNIIRLNAQEISLIEVLLEQSEEYVSFQTLQSSLGKKDFISIDSLRTLVRNIRKKTYPDIISNLSGIGYKINLDKNLDNNKINILIVDDEKTNLMFLKLLITKNLDDVNLLFAHDGAEAIDMLKTKQIDIILLDIQMPVIDGWGVAKFIQENKDCNNIAIIFITSVFVEDDFQKRGFDLGAVDYITKPIIRNQFINRLKLYVKNFLNEKKILEELEKNKQKDKFILQQEVLLAQSDVLDKIAHHWRQPLSTISANAGTIKMMIELNQIDEKSIKQILQYCSNIEEVTNNLSNIIEQFIKFFRPTTKSSDFNLKESIDNSLEIVSSKIELYNINIELDMEDIVYHGCETIFKQVLLTLLNNSFHILKEKNNQNDRYVKIILNKHKDEIVLSVIDNGGGIDPKIENKIYEPYFTTKHAYSGTGLGLYLAKEFVNRYFNGNLTNKNIEYNFNNKSYDSTKFVLKFKTKKGN